MCTVVCYNVVVQVTNLPRECRSSLTRTTEQNADLLFTGLSVDGSSSGFSTTWSCLHEAAQMHINVL